MFILEHPIQITLFRIHLVSVIKCVYRSNTCAVTEFHGRQRVTNKPSTSPTKWTGSSSGSPGYYQYPPPFYGTWSQQRKRAKGKKEWKRCFAWEKLLEFPILEFRSHCSGCSVLWLGAEGRNGKATKNVKRMY